MRLICHIEYLLAALKSYNPVKPKQLLCYSAGDTNSPPGQAYKEHVHHKLMGSTEENGSDGEV